MSDKEEEKKPTSSDAADETSDVELEGMDLDDDNEETADGDDDDDNDDEMANATVPESPTKEAPIDEERQHQLEEEEAKEMEAARNERMELMQAAQESAPKDAASKLEYLLGQSEVFAHFMAGTFISFHDIRNLEELPET